MTTAIEDDEEVILLTGKANALLAELKECDVQLAELKPTRRLSPREFGELRKQRAKIIKWKERTVLEYREAKEALKTRRRELQLAARDVERDLRSPEDIIRALLAAAIESGAYQDPTHQRAIDAARRWLGEAFGA